MNIKYKLDLEAEIVLVTGDHNWKSIKTVNLWLQKFIYLELVIHGAADGADMAADIVCGTDDIPCMRVPAKWSKHHKAAGPIRNNEMIKWLKVLNQSEYQNMAPEFTIQVLAFHTDIKNSKGTKDMIKKAKDAGFSVYLVDTLVD